MCYFSKKDTVFHCPDRGRGANRPPLFFINWYAPVSAPPYILLARKAENQIIRKEFFLCRIITTTALAAGAPARPSNRQEAPAGLRQRPTPLSTISVARPSADTAIITTTIGGMDFPGGFSPF